MQIFKLAGSLLLTVLFFHSCGEPDTAIDPNAITISLTDLEKVAEVDERFQSYNVEMAEVVGGDFWIAYELMDTTKTPTIDGSKEIGVDQNRYRYRPPVDLSNKRLRMLASALSPAFVRVSGSWANSVYFQDNDEEKMEKAPEGFKNVLSRKEWAGVNDFVKATDSDLMISFTISSGVRDSEKRWTPVQAEAVVDYTKSIGGKIDAVQFFNEPNMPEYAGAPKGYSATDFALDVQAFNEFIDEALPGVPVAGPDAVGEGGMGAGNFKMPLPSDALLSAEPKPEFDIFAYHHYGGVSQRCATSGPMHSPVDSAMTPNWLNKTLKTYEFYAQRRDEYLPGKPMWLAETAEAACGGNPWAAEFIDVFRYVSQMGKLAKKDVKIIMHNTLTASDYGMLEQKTHEPRPNYWAALLWRQHMGTEVFDAGINVDGADFYIHSHPDKPGTKTLLVVNYSDAPVAINLPGAAQAYALTAEKLRTKKVMLNGTPLALTADDQLPELKGAPLEAGTNSVAAQSISFFVL